MHWDLIISGNLFDEMLNLKIRKLFPFLEQLAIAKGKKDWP